MLLEIKDLNVSYEERPILKNISLSVENGEILGIVGESGSGKSTILKTILGILGKNGKVESGNIYYEGNEILLDDSLKMQELCGEKIGMVFQNTVSTLSPIRTIDKQLIEFVQEHKNWTKQEIRTKALKMLDQMGLKDGKRILKSYPFQLSGGMNQRIGILFAMILNPPLLLADEPTSALDVTTAVQVVKEMLFLKETYHTSMIVVSHHMGVIDKMADKIAVVHNGKIVEYGTKEQVMHDPKSEVTKKLLGSVLYVKRKKKCRH